MVLRGVPCTPRTTGRADATFTTDVTKTNRHFEWWSSHLKYYNYNVTGQVTNNIRVKFAGSNQRNANRGTAPACNPTTAS